MSSAAGLIRVGPRGGFLLASALLVSACIAAPSLPSPSVSAHPPSPVPSPDLGAIRDTIFADYKPELLGVGIGRNDVAVQLVATATRQADEILARYGPIVQVSVGFFPYPRPAVLPRNACAGFPGWPIVDPGPIRATLELASTQLSHVASFSAKVRVTNTGRSPVTISTGEPLEVYLYRPRETAPIGASPAAVGGVGLGPTLKPGQSFDIEAGGGTASCDLALGYELPDGPYIARAAVELDQPSAPGYFWSQPLPVELGPGT
jgi:hypothetical protein